MIKYSWDSKVERFTLKKSMNLIQFIDSEMFRQFSSTQYLKALKCLHFKSFSSWVELNWLVLISIILNNKIYEIFFLMLHPFSLYLIILLITLNPSFNFISFSFELDGWIFLISRRTPMIFWHRIMPKFIASGNKNLIRTQ